MTLDRVISRSPSSEISQVPVCKINLVLVLRPLLLLSTFHHSPTHSQPNVYGFWTRILSKPLTTIEKMQMGWYWSLFCCRHLSASHARWKHPHHRDLWKLKWNNLTKLKAYEKFEVPIWFKLQQGSEVPSSNHQVKDEFLWLHVKGWYLHKETNLLNYCTWILHSTYSKCNQLLSFPLEQLLSNTWIFSYAQLHFPDLAQATSQLDIFQYFHLEDAVQCYLSVILP